jgi:hypothetical protein
MLQDFLHDAIPTPRDGLSFPNSCAATLTPHS